MSAKLIRLLDPDVIKALATLFGEFGEAAGVIKTYHRLEDGRTSGFQGFRAPTGAAASTGSNFDLYTITRKLEAFHILEKLAPLLPGLQTTIIPPIAALFDHSTALIPWTLSRYAKASVKLNVSGNADTAEYIIKWASQNCVDKNSDGKARHVVITEEVKRDGQEKISTFKVLKSDGEAWRVIWKGKIFYISIVRRSNDDKKGKKKETHDQAGNDANVDAMSPDNTAGMFGSHGGMMSAFGVSRPKSSIDHVLLECYGSDNAPIIDLLDHCKEEMRVVKNINASVTVVRMTANGHKTDHIPGRALDTLDYPGDKSEKLLADGLNFFDPEVRRWNQINGSPWRRGYLFSGPPGTGKSSFAHALATELRLEIFTIDLRGMTDDKLVRSFEQLPDDGCILLLEDLDGAGLICDDKADETTDKRAKEDCQSPILEGQSGQNPFGQAFMGPSGFDEPTFGSNPNVSFAQHHNQSPARNPRQLGGRNRRNAHFGSENDGEPSRNGKKQRVGVTISCLINLLDGVGAKQGRLLIITTNHSKRLDPRILRSGRVSRPYHKFGFSDKETAAKTYKRMFGTYPTNPPTGDKLDALAKLFGNQMPPNFISPAEVQEYCSSYRGKPEEAVLEFGTYLQQKREGKLEEAYDMDDEAEVQPEVFADEEQKQDIAEALRKINLRADDAAQNDRLTTWAADVAAVVAEEQHRLDSDSICEREPSSASFADNLDTVFRRLNLDVEEVEGDLTIVSPRPTSVESSRISTPVARAVWGINPWLLHSWF